MFDYEALDADTRERLSLRARVIRPQMYRAATEMVALGHSLAKAKVLLGHYGFGQWMLHEFLWSQDVTWRFLMIAKRFGVAPVTLETACTSLSMLVAPTAAESACFEALMRRALGQTMTEEVLRNIIIQRRALGLTVEDLAELTGIEIAPPPEEEEDAEEAGEEVDADEKVDEDEKGDEDDKGDEVEENDADEAEEGCRAESRTPSAAWLTHSRSALRPFM